jgi:hypothetical protein
LHICATTCGFIRQGKQHVHIVSKAAGEGVLERKRNVTAVVATWFLAKTYPDIRSSRNLSEFLLTDVNVSATSGIRIFF